MSISSQAARATVAPGSSGQGPALLIGPLKARLCKPFDQLLVLLLHVPGSTFFCRLWLLSTRLIALLPVLSGWWTALLRWATAGHNKQGLTGSWQGSGDKRTRGGAKGEHRAGRAWDWQLAGTKCVVLHSR